MRSVPAPDGTSRPGEGTDAGPVFFSQGCGPVMAGSRPGGGTDAGPVQVLRRYGPGKHAPACAARTGFRTVVVPAWHAQPRMRMGADPQSTRGGSPESMSHQHGGGRHCDEGSMAHSARGRGMQAEAADQLQCQDDLTTVTMTTTSNNDGMHGPAMDAHMVSEIMRSRRPSLASQTDGMNGPADSGSGAISPNPSPRVLGRVAIKEVRTCNAAVTTMAEVPHEAKEPQAWTNEAIHDAKYMQCSRGGGLVPAHSYGSQPHTTKHLTMQPGGGLVPTYSVRSQGLTDPVQNRPHGNRVSSCQCQTPPPGRRDRPHYGLWQGRGLTRRGESAHPATPAPTAQNNTHHQHQHQQQRYRGQ